METAETTITKTGKGAAETYETAPFEAPPPAGAARKAAAPRAKAKAAREKAEATGTTKGAAIVAYYAKHPTATRSEVAKAVGCVVGRVGEVVRAGLLPEGVGVGRGGETKGDAILEWFRAANRGTRAEVAEAVGCVPGRVGEVVRANPGLIVKGEDGKYGAKPAKAPRARKG